MYRVSPRLLTRTRPRLAIDRVDTCTVFVAACGDCVCSLDPSATVALTTTARATTGTVVISFLRIALDLLPRQSPVGHWSNDRTLATCLRQATIHRGS